MGGVTFIGNITVDFIKVIDNYPAMGNLGNILSLSRSVGGLAANTPVDLKVMAPELDVITMGMVGDDENGKYITGAINSFGVDVSKIKVHKSLPTSFTDVMAVLDTGDRTFFQAQGAGAVYGFEDIDFNSVKTDIAHVGYALLMNKFDSPDAEYGTQMAKILAKLRSIGVKTSIDVVSENSDRFARILKPSLKQADYVFMNEIESAKTVGISARNDEGKLSLSRIKRICAALIELGVREMAVIHAPEGGWAMTAAGNFYSEPAFDLPHGYIKGTVGAGDAFCAGMLYSIIKGLDPARGLAVAGAAAACNLSEKNSTDGMRPIKDVLKLEKEFSKRVSWID